MWTRRSDHTDRKLLCTDVHTRATWPNTREMYRTDCERANNMSGL